MNTHTKKTVEQIAIKAVSEPNWTGLSIIELAEAGRIPGDSFAEICDKLAINWQHEYCNAGMSINELLGANDRFKAACMNNLKGE